MAADAKYFGSLTERRLLLTPAQIARLPDMECSADTVRRHIRRYDVPRRDAAGWEKADGAFVYLCDFENRFSGSYTTNAQCRSDLRRAGLIS